MARGIDGSRTRCESDLGGLKNIKLLKNWWAEEKKRIHEHSNPQRYYFYSLSYIRFYANHSCPKKKKKKKIRNDHPLSSNPISMAGDKKPGKNWLSFHSSLTTSFLIDPLSKCPGTVQSQTRLRLTLPVQACHNLALINIIFIVTQLAGNKQRCLSNPIGRRCKNIRLSVPGDIRS